MNSSAALGMFMGVSVCVLGYKYLLSNSLNLLLTLLLSVWCSKHYIKAWEQGAFSSLHQTAQQNYSLYRAQRRRQTMSSQCAGTHGSSSLSLPHRGRMGDEGQCPAPSCGEENKCLKDVPLPLCSGAAQTANLMTNVSHLQKIKCNKDIHITWDCCEVIELHL